MELTVTIKGHTYEMGRKEFKDSIKKIIKMIPKEPTIVAVEKNGHAEMRRDVYKTQKELTNAINEWNKKGYRVEYTRGM